MVRLNKVGAEYPVEILAKCEFLNPGGSVKERVAYRMVEEAERQGRLKPGDTLIEATSGNTGIGLAMACAIKGYRLIITLPEKMSREKQLAMEALGAEIVRTPTGAAHDSPDSNFAVAERLCKEIPNAHILDQWTNPANPDSHYYGTAEEILEQTGGKFDYFVCGVGTGGTITGVARRLREAAPNVKIIGVDPEGSIIGGGEPGGPYIVEGIGYDFIPAILDQTLVDEYIKTNDPVSLKLALRLIREEGMLVGGSSGSAMQGALEIAKRCKGGERIVVILPDNVRNYMSKFLDPVWRAERGLGF
ncbi:cystathionine beta-synthase [Fimbriimonas ginsengisoli Gsoil 348]|uniref:Cystathionine beta-synthase n=2 Tax=Fimbriimonas ginsengisoli TaxID=1005039 RepID=A0A068NUG3_FIMGI|nr:cystathionine beta-synthase [Fimbriimonas ginsengisoli Gsoil 348]